MYGKIESCCSGNGPGPGTVVVSLDQRSNQRIPEDSKESKRASGAVHCLNCRLRERCLPREIPKADVDRFEGIVERGAPVRRGEVIYQQGKPFLAVYAVLSGCVKTVRERAGHTPAIVGVSFPGSVIGLDGFNSGIHDATAVALDTTAICEIPLVALRSLMSETPVLRHNLFEAISRRIIVEQEILLALRNSSADARVAIMLLHVSGAFRRRKLSAVCFRLPMTRIEIANCLGLSTERVSRSFGRFKAKGWITEHNRDVQLLDRPALERLAGWNVLK